MNREKDSLEQDRHDRDRDRLDWMVSEGWDRDAARKKIEDGRSEGDAAIRKLRQEESAEKQWITMALVAIAGVFIAGWML